MSINSVNTHVFWSFFAEFLNNQTTTKCSNKLTTKEPPATNHKLSKAQAQTNPYSIPLKSTLTRKYLAILY